MRAFADEVVNRFVLHVTEGTCFADKVRFVFMEVIVDCSSAAWPVNFNLKLSQLLYTQYSKRIDINYTMD